jgi:hypothetical protein
VLGVNVQVIEQRDKIQLNFHKNIAIEVKIENKIGSKPKN